jgi:hypothetical protein
MLAELSSGLIAVENGCPMKEEIAVMECWSNGVMGMAELHPSHGTAGVVWVIIPNPSTALRLNSVRELAFRGAIPRRRWLLGMTSRG